ncbi:SMP-30/gluconolactonase/LRE family protein [Nocardia sp. NPDC059240]|uniref:SMP-30/gluconolactonase/LRE family protein n=1 Tax=Nocardia sp. NPDC059240 TaxID=3346786 RepID=UPI003683DB9C
MTTLAAAAVAFYDWAENLGYDAQGNLWVSRLYRNVVQRYDTAGRVTATVPVTSPGAIRLGPDHQLYVVYGDNSMNLLPGTHDSGVVRFDPTATAPVPQTFVSGLSMPNGAAFDTAGNLYIADTGSGVVRVRPDATIDTDWSAQAKMFGLNGIAVAGDSIYTTLYLSSRGQILRIPIDTPAQRTVAADLNLSDDLAAGADGLLYVATTAGNLVRVDPESHDTCTVLSGGPFAAVVSTPDSERDLTVSTGSGDILRVHLIS